MGWIAGYHDRFEFRRHEVHKSWAVARAAVVDELGQRIMGLESDPGIDDRAELDELEDARRYFADGVAEGEEAAADAGGLTFFLVPEVAAELYGQVDELLIGIIQ
jgi:hypothetical protein